MRIADKAGRTRTVTARDIELFSELTVDRNPLHYDVAAASASRFGDTITAEVEVLEMRVNKPIITLKTTITNQTGSVVLDGTPVVYSEPRMHAHPLHPSTARMGDQWMSR